MEVISWLLHHDPSQRATVQDMERDPWVYQPIDITEYDWHDVLPNSGTSEINHLSLSLNLTLLLYRTHVTLNIIV